MNIERIPSYGNDGMVDRSQQRTETTRQNGVSPEQVAPKRDKLTLSQAARDMEGASRAVENAPDVREDRIRALKARIEAGTYTVSDEDLAKAMLAAAAAGDVGV